MSKYQITMTIEVDGEADDGQVDDMLNEMADCAMCDGDVSINWEVKKDGVVTTPFAEEGA